MFLHISLSSRENKCSVLQSVPDKIFQHNTDLHIVLVTPRSNVNLRLTLMNIPLLRRVELKVSSNYIPKKYRYTQNEHTYRHLPISLRACMQCKQQQYPAQEYWSLSKLSLKRQHLGSVCSVFQHPICPREIVMGYSI